MPLKRNCKYLIGSKDGKRAIYLDEENKDEILAYLYNKCKDVTAMKFFKGQENDRIYCKEVHSTEGTFIVVAAILYERKKTTKVNQEQINLIEKVANYQYEI